MSYSTQIACLSLFLALHPLSLCAEPAPEATRKPKQIFAHYMGCYPVGVGGLAPAALRKVEGDLKPEGPSYLDRIGGRWRDFPLLPADLQLTLEESVDLEMRRAMRMGLDGFAVDVLAGQKTALASLDAMFKVAEEKKYPFQITFCLDNPKQNLEAVQHLMEKHGKSPNLARRDGKPLLLGYRSHRWGQRVHPEASKADWANPENVRYQCDAIKELETVVGQPLYVQFDLNGYMEDIPKESSTDPAFWRAAAAEFAKSYGGLSGFFWGGENYNTAAKAAREAGLDWGEPLWYQYQNLYWNTFRCKEGIDLLQERWDRAIANDATLIQIATWNDYTETTHVAPAMQTGYAINDLMGLMIQRWKGGGWPNATKDRLYLIYAPYPKGSKVYPFQDFAPEIGGDLEVVTYLTQPATVVLPGRDATWEAPAGFSVKKLPPTPGPVIAELQRNGKPVISLKAREPITDRPFRAQHSMVAYSTEDERQWNEDFPGKPQPTGYYADNDGDGLPNWFEMYYFGKLGDFTTATAAKPGDSSCGDGRTNLQAYLSQSNPLKPQPPPAAGTVWDLLKNPIGGTGVSTNPEVDPEDRRVWRYLSSTPAGKWELLGDAAISFVRDVKPALSNAMPHMQAMQNTPIRDVSTVTHSNITRNTLVADGTPPNAAQVIYRWTKLDEQGTEFKRTVALGPVPGAPVAIEWQSPANGSYQIEIGLDSLNNPNLQIQLVGDDGKVLWQVPTDAKNPSAQTSLKVPLKQGQSIRLEAQTSKASNAPLPEVTRFEISLALLEK